MRYFNTHTHTHTHTTLASHRYQNPTCGSANTVRVRVYDDEARAGLKTPAEKLLSVDVSVAACAALERETIMAVPRDVL